MEVAYNKWYSVKSHPPDKNSYKKVLFFRKKYKIYVAKAPAHGYIGSYDYWMPMPPVIEGVNTNEEGIPQDKGE